MRDFGMLSAEAARAYHDAYIVGAPLRSAWLLAEASATGAPEGVADGEAGLDDLWAWFKGRLDAASPLGLRAATPLPIDDPQAGPHPPWWAGGDHPFVSLDGLWVVDAFGCHLARLVMARLPEVEWDVYRAPKRRMDINQNHTMLTNLPCGWAEPADMVYGEVVRHVHNGQPWLDGALQNLYDYLVLPAGEWQSIR